MTLPTESNRSRRKPRFAVRTIRDGKVRILGKTFAPRTPYDGRLDGQRFAFGLYPDAYHESKRDSRHFVSLWGTERAYKWCATASEDDEDMPDWPGPHCVDGKFLWEWWVEVDESC